MPRYYAYPETQYLRNRPPNQFLYFMKRCAELHKPKLKRGSQAKIFIFKGRKWSLKLATVTVIKIHFLGPDLVLAIFRFWL